MRTNDSAFDPNSSDYALNPSIDPGHKHTQASSPGTIALGVSAVDDGLSLLQNVTTSTSGTSRLVRVVGFNCSNPRLVFTNWATSFADLTDCFDIDGSGTIAFNASLEVVSTGQIYRVTFNGRTTCTLDAGGQVISDPVSIDLTAGQTVAFRTFLSSGTTYVNGAAWSVNGAGFTSTTDLTAPGSAAPTVTTAFVFCPVTMIALPTGRGPSVLLQGTSIERGQGDGADGTLAGFLPLQPWISSGGYVNRAISGAAGMMSIAIPDDSLIEFFTQNNGHYRRMGLANYCKSAIIGYGVNDLSQGQTAKQLSTNILALAELNVRYGITTTYITTVLPNSSSTDGWITLANQTTASWNSVRVTHNTWVRAGGPISPTTLLPLTAGTPGALTFGQPGHPIAGYFDTAATVESSFNSGLWAPASHVITDAHIVSGAATLTSASAPFVNSLISAGGSLGSTVSVVGAGAAGAVLTSEYISAFSSVSSVTVTSNASTTVTGATAGIGVKSTDGTHPSSDAHLLMSAAINLALLT